MGRQQVRSAFASAIQSAGIANVGTVFPGRPTIVTGSAYTQTMQGQAVQESQNGSACVVVVNIDSDTRTRYADAGRGALADWNKHIVTLELWFASTAGDSLAAQEDYDAIVDGLFDLIRSNPTMSAPSYVWSAGEFRYGIQHEQSVPYNPEQSTEVLIDGEIRVEAWEQVTGPV